MNETLDVFLFLPHFIQKINLSDRSRPKLSETIDQGIKLWWLSYEGSMRPFRGRLTPKMAWSAPPGRSGMIVNLLLRLVFVHKTPVGNFSQGWWWLSWVHQITAMADRTNYASICSALPGYILTWKRSSVFSGEGNCIVRKISPFLMRGKCKPWQNLISGAKKCSRKWWRDILPF